MKLSLKLTPLNILIMIMMALVLLGSGGLFWRNAQAEEERNRIVDTVDKAELALERARKAADVTEFQRQLTEAQNRLKQMDFPKAVASLDFVNFVVRSTIESGVEIQSLQLSTSTKEKLAAAEYQAHKYRMQLRGQLPQISTFLGKMEQGAFNTLVMENLSLAPKDRGWEGSLDMTIYFLSGT
ncbi:MAG: hypothetical protein HYX88_02570 [Chloroflexi bacterium]|nr:hypothetical protein [Chloroflexota bacterium]